MPEIKSVQQIKFEIMAHIKEFGSNFDDWYVGVADNPKEALFKKHKLDPDRDIWMYKQALSLAACKTVQRYFLDTLNTDGEPPANGTEDTDCVYLYKKSARTVP